MAAKPKPEPKKKQPAQPSVKPCVGCRWLVAPLRICRHPLCADLVTDFLSGMDKRIFETIEEARAPEGACKIEAILFEPPLPLSSLPNDLRTE